MLPPSRSAIPYDSPNTLIASPCGNASLSFNDSSLLQLLTATCLQRSSHFDSSWTYAPGSLCSAPLVVFNASSRKASSSDDMDAFSSSSLGDGHGC
ncbi:unnamed protein product [Phytophthora fragariaefolia]|uniref:Unnamed protein product n=1 Tax=Phytophthora fragariaefolia TaxID=1490495 RepID=A0A9W6X585_9STRA|nr:unnamed protein product [Phytophthora fragariaefolia]